MSAPAAIKGTFSDFRVVRGRKIAQLVVEVPIEQADEALRALGGVPVAANERWVAVARLDPQIASQRPLQEPARAIEKPRRSFGELPLAQQAAIRCQDGKFQQFLGVASAEEAAVCVRDECRVGSRADIESAPYASQRWHEIERDFSEYLRGAR